MVDTRSSKTKSRGKQVSEKREIEIKLKSKSAESSADSLNKKVRGVGQSADSADASFLDLKKSIDKLSAGVATISKLDKSVDGLSTSIQQSNAQMVKGTAATSNLDKNIDILNKSVSSADNSMDELTQSLSKNALTTSNANAKTKDFDNSMKSMDSTVERSVLSIGKLSLVASAVATALATSQIQKYADSWTNVNNRLNAATSTQAEFLAAQKGVIAIAQQAGVDLAGVADGYSRIAQNTSELGLSQARVLDITKKVTLAIKAGGATAQEAASVMVQLGQGLGVGALQGEELKAIMEASIPITKALAKEFGVTTGELKALGANGEITADRVVSAIERMDESSLTFTKDISGGFAEVSNALTVYVGSVDESLGITEKITGALSSTAENLDTVVEGVTTLAVLIGAKYVGSLTSAVVAQTALTAAGLRGTVQMNALGQVTSRTTVAMNVGSVAAKGLSASLAALGGPVGIALIAAYALYEFTTSTNDVANGAESAAIEVDKLSKAQAALASINISESMNKLSDDAEKYGNKIGEINRLLDKGARNQVSFSKLGVATISSVKLTSDEIKVLNNQLIEEQALLDGVNQKYKEQSDLLVKLSSKEGGSSAGKDLDDAMNDNSVFGFKKEGKNKEKPVEDNGFTSLKARLKLETQAIQEEAEVRRAFAEGLINQQQLDEELALQNVFFTYENRRAAILENEKLTHEQRAELLAELAQQEINAEQIKQDQLKGVTQKGSEERNKISLLEQNAKISNMQSGASAALSLVSAFGKKSSKAQKAFAIADGIVNIAAGVAKALNNPYPANLGFAAQVAAQGAGLIATIKGASPDGATITPSLSAPSSPSTYTPAPPSIENQSQSRIINITGLDGFGDDQPIPLTIGGLRDLLSSNEDVNIAINNGQQNAARIGAI